MTSDFMTSLARRLAEDARIYVFPLVNEVSGTLARSIEVKVHGAGVSAISIPYYWAVYVNDGRGTFGPIRGKFLVWFRYPQQDPRLPGGHFPVRASEIRRMTREDWAFWQKENRLAISLGLPPPMIVARRVRTPTNPTKIFENDGGMAGFSAHAAPIVADAFSAYVRSRVGDRLQRSGEIRLIL